MAGWWVFGYGSLMWKPGFEFDYATRARLEGAHRALCVYSVNHRGTRRFPGLVFGLDVSGACEGVAYHVPQRAMRTVAAYLRAREQVTKVYNQALKPVTLLDGSGRTVRAQAYMVNRAHRQYAGRLPLCIQASIVRRARGKSGRNVDYVMNTAAHLRDMNINEPHLERLMTMLGRNKKRWLRPTFGGEALDDASVAGAAEKEM
ncbi:MAG: gamma-glutamylcyclotransferase [Hyphomicrobiales bacterium]|nr:gamma-glutamylcyclotransferase [Hyphomicrobiales bacterium]